jgi:hypothetical protein
VYTNSKANAVCRQNFPKSPYSKDAACPSIKIREDRFDRQFLKGNPTAKVPVAHQQRVRPCDSLTFEGKPSENATIPGGVMNPKLPNQFTLTGALVSHFNPTGEPEYYTDTRSDGSVSNPQSQISLDYNAALTNAVAGIAAMPKTFFARGCPSISKMIVMLDEDKREDKKALEQAQLAVQ